jgi:hypothetical protein
MGLTRIRAQQITDLDYKQAVRVVTIADVNLNGGAPNQVDGVTLSTNNRILVARQDNRAQNGLYQVQTTGAGSNGTWIRTADANATGEVEPGMLVMVTEGIAYADTLWKLITNGEIVIGETELTFELNTPFGFGNIYANGTSIVSSSQSDVLLLTAGENITIVGNATSKTIEFSSTSGTPGGNTTEVQYNNAGSFAGSENFTFDGSNVSVSGNITASYFLGNGSQLSGIITSVANINNGNSNVAIDSAGSNITVGIDGTSNVVVMSPDAFSVAANIIPAANITYNLGSDSARWNDIFLSGSTIYLGTIQLKDSGSNTLGIFQSDGTTPADINGVAANAAYAESAGTAATVTNANQSNITSVGTLTSLDVTGNISGGNINTAGNVQAAFFKGDGSLLTGVAGGGGISWTTSATAPASPNPGDFWYDTDDDKTYQYVNDGVGNAWVDQSSPTSFSTLTVANILNGGANGAGNIGSSTGYFNTVFAKATSAQYADLAENYVADRCYEPGTVVIFGGDAEVSVSPVSHDPRVAGVISTNPSYLMNSGLTGPTVAAVALTGRVPCWVQGPVAKGDRIVNAGTGIGGRLDLDAYEPGCIVGKSLEDITDDSTQLIEVVIGRF